MKAKVSFNTFIRNITLSWPHICFDEDGCNIVSIKLISKKNAPFKFKYIKNNVKVSEYIYDERLLYPIQIKEKIYNDYYLTSDN